MLLRHGPLVWNVCRRLLTSPQDAEDAFQATFLVLVHKPSTICKQASVAGWLYGVARRIALKARAQAQRRHEPEAGVETPSQKDALSEAADREVQDIVDQEVVRLPERLRVPVILCCLEGRSKAEAARQLGWKEGTVASRLARARHTLQKRLERRGIVLSALGGLLLVDQARTAVPIGTTLATLRMATLCAAGGWTSSLTAPVAALAKGVLHTMALSKLKTGAVLILTLCALVAGVGWTAHSVLLAKPAEEGPTATKTMEQALPEKGEVSPETPYFKDVTADSGIHHTYHNGEEAGHLSLLESLGGGAALIDYDGDGLLDVLLTGGGYFDGPDRKQIKGYPCKLYKNLGNFKFKDVTREVGLDQVLFYTHGCAIADYDNDGWPDILLTGWGRLALLHNEPDGKGGRHFVDVTQKAGLTSTHWSTSAGWADFDGDGFVDLYVVHYVDWSFDNNSIWTKDRKVPAPEGSKVKSAEKTFAFEFRNAPWDDVLEWFTKQSGLRRIGTNRPTGTFTFIPQKGVSYKLPEVIDILNEAMLSNPATQKWLLVRSSQSFTIVPADKPVEATLINRVPVEDLPKYGKTEVVQVVVTPKSLAARDIQSAIRAMKSPFGQLLLTDTVSSINNILKPREISPPKLFKALPHILYRNNGNGTFTDVSKSAGLRVPRQPEDYLSLQKDLNEGAVARLKQADRDSDYGKGLGITIVDLNADGRPDLYVGNDTTDNFLYINRSRPGHILFEEMGLEAGVARDDRGLPHGGTGGDAGDPLGTGRPCLWQCGNDNELPMLFSNECRDDRILFRFVTHSLGLGAIKPVFVGWGTHLVDFDLDGWEDLFVSNGHVLRFPGSKNLREMGPRAASAPASAAVAIAEHIGSQWPAPFRGEESPGRKLFRGSSSRSRRGFRRPEQRRSGGHGLEQPERADRRAQEHGRDGPSLAGRRSEAPGPP